MVPHDLVFESASGSLCSMHDSVRKLSAEGCGYLVFVGEGMGGEGDGWLGMRIRVVRMFEESVGLGKVS